jgi:multiple sugar transport system ATP-binding protein
MKSGKIQQVGTPLEIYDRPENAFVANFVGTPPMNFFRAAVRDGGRTLAASRFALPVPPALEPLTRSADGRDVLVGIRPEHLVDPAAPPRGESARIRAVVELVEPLGDETIVHARAGDDLFVYKVAPDRAPETGRAVDVAVELERVHLFDAATEERLGN